MTLKFLCPPAGPLSNADLVLKRRIHWLLFLRVVVLTLLLGMSLLLQSKEHNIPIPPLIYVGYFIAGIYLFTLLSAFMLRAIRCYRRFAYIQLVVDSLLVSCLVIFTGYTQSIFTILYFFPIITAGFLLYRTGGLLLAAVNTLCYGAIVASEYLHYPLLFLAPSGQTPLTDITVAMHYFSIHGLTFFLVGFLSSKLPEQLRSAEEALSQTTADYDRLATLYKQIFDDIGTGIITVNKSGVITSFNPASEEITGFPASAVVGKMLNQQFPGLEAKKTTFTRPIVDLIRKDGEKIPVGYSWAKLKTSDENENWRVYTMQDLSHVKKMEEQVKQAEKMAAIGEMAAGIAHEFRNPLAAISGAAQLICHEAENDPATQRLMNIITRECDRMEETVTEFLLFSRPATPGKKWFSLPMVTNEVINLLRQATTWDDSCTIAVDIPPHLDCWADPQQLKQVLLNLINNSCNAMADSGGRVCIGAVEKKQPDGSERMVIEVVDNGPGIPEKVLDKIFEPFFTTRENGTGLGLAIVKQIIDSHEGEITVTSQQEKGTAITISLPLP